MEYLVILLAVLVLAGSISIAIPSKASRKISKLRIEAKILGCKILSTLYVVTQLKTIIPILVDHPSFTKALGEKGRSRVIERYTIKKNIEALEKLYLDSIKNI